MRKQSAQIRAAQLLNLEGRFPLCGNGVGGCHLCGRIWRDCDGCNQRKGESFPYGTNPFQCSPDRQTDGQWGGDWTKEGGRKTEEARSQELANGPLSRSECDESLCRHTYSVSP